MKARYPTSRDTTTILIKARTTVSVQSGICANPWWCFEKNLLHCAQIGRGDVSGPELNMGLSDYVEVL